MFSNPDMLITIVTLLGAVVLLAGSFIRNDLVAVMVILALVISGVLNVPEALSGFSNSAVIVIACMFIVGKAITNTGIAQQVGDSIIKYGGSNEKKLLIMLMGAAAAIGSFMSSTATAAIFIPITLSVAEKAGLNHKRMLMPLAVAALISGMMTLVATTPNIVVNSTLRSRNMADLSFFSFTPYGVVILLFAMLFMAVLGQKMLASKTDQSPRKKGPGIDDLLRYHKIDKNEFVLRIPADSELVNSSVAKMQLSSIHNVILLAVQSREKGRRRKIIPAGPEIIFRADDLILLIGNAEAVKTFAGIFGLDEVEVGDLQRRSFFQVVGVAEVMLSPESALIGKSVRETMFQTLFSSMVLGIRRKGETITEKLSDTPLKYGDVLLVCGAWKDIMRLEKHREQYLLLTLPQDYKEVAPAKSKNKIAVLILAAMVALIAFNLLAPAVAILAAALALVLTRCVPVSSVYTTVDWQTIIMLAGIFPLALALQKTGIIGHVSGVFMHALAGENPLLVLAGLFLITSTLGIFISNSAVAALVAPMAVDIGLALNISPQACAMTVAISCSAAFISPFGSPVHMLVREPGGYKMLDYVKTGVPLLAISLGITMAICRVMYL